jgi:inosine-uridine nucleoside N-ribohydrolase
MAAHDPLAALVLTDPDTVMTERRAVAVGIDGEERGACLDATDARPAIQVALAVDVDRARDGLLHRLGAP